MVAHFTVRSVAAVCSYWTKLVVSNTAVHQEIPEAFFHDFLVHFTSTHTCIS